MWAMPTLQIISVSICNKPISAFYSIDDEQYGLSINLILNSFYITKYQPLARSLN